MTASERPVNTARRADGRVMYARVRTGNGTLELGETEPSAASMLAGFYLYVDDADGWYERAVAAGGKSLMQPADQPYGERVAAVEDSMGNSWYLARRA